MTKFHYVNVSVVSVKYVVNTNRRLIDAISINWLNEGIAFLNLTRPLGTLLLMSSLHFRQCRFIMLQWLHVTLHNLSVLTISNVVE